MLQPELYVPDFTSGCRVCQASPTVLIDGAHTGLCGPHFFDDPAMWDEEEWNREKESTE